MILCDGVHMISTTSEAELHAFARKVGLKRGWFQASRLHPHYDILSARYLTRAFILGARKVTTKEIIMALRERR